MKKLSAKLLMALLLISFTTTTISAADWGLFELKGKVKSVTYYNEAGHIDWEGWKYLEASIDGTVKFPISVQYLIRIMAVTPEERIDGTIKRRTNSESE